MNIQGNAAVRPTTPTGGRVQAGGGETTVTLGVMPDRFEASWQNGPGYPSYPSYPPSYPGYPDNGYCPPQPPYQDNRNFFQKILDFFTGRSYSPYNPGNVPYYPGSPAEEHGYIPPEPAYNGQMNNLLDRYDQQQEQLRASRQWMSDGQYTRQERDLWTNTCNQIVRSWASREEKLGALGHVLNSSSMYYSDFERYARMVG